MFYQDVETKGLHPPQQLMTCAISTSSFISTHIAFNTNYHMLYYTPIY
jgi:hypothetical protein